VPDAAAALLRLTPSRTQSLPTEPDVARSHLSATRTRVARAPAVLPYRSRAHRTREACTARHCQSSPEMLHPCCAGLRRRTPAPLSLPHFLLHATPHP
jgi:hypothetical protein